MEGSVLVRKNEIEMINFMVNQRDMEPTKKWEDTKGFQIVRKGEIPHRGVEPKVIAQNIKMSVDAYNFMIAVCPSFIKSKVWDILNDTQRLEAQLQRTCEHLGGKSFSYEIFED